MCYPRYTRRQISRLTGRELVEEHLAAGHVRVYLQDCRGQLRLIFINQGTIDAVSEEILLVKFGVSYFDLGMDWAKSSMKVHLSLDARCLWPKALFPDGQPATMPMPDMALFSGRDAWL